MTISKEDFLKIYGGQKSTRVAARVPSTPKKPSSQPSERSEQIKIHQWWAYQYPKLWRLFVHVPNEAARSMIAGSLLRRQGMKAGFPDIFIAVPRGAFHGLFIELKVGANKPTDTQRLMMADLMGQSYAGEFCWGADEAIKQIVQYMQL